MLIEEAREVLGVAAGATADEVRRAYLRAVRRHRPERDPDGFRRVRQAFEVLRSGEGGGPPPVPPALASDAAPPADQGGGPTEVATFPAATGTEAPEKGEGPPPEAQPLDDATMQEILDAGHARMRRVLEAPSARELGAPATVALQAALYAVTVGNLAGARRLVRELKGPLAEELQEAQRRIPHLSVWWRAVRELVHLPDGFPAGPRTAMARAVMSLDFSLATPRLRDFARRKPQPAADAAMALEAGAPLLDEHFGKLLLPRQIQVYAKPTAGTLVLFVLVVILRFCEDSWVGSDDRRGQRSAQARPTAAELAREEVYGESVARRAVTDICERRWPPSTAWECDLATDIVEAVDAGDCRTAAGRWDDYRNDRAHALTNGQRVSKTLFRSVFEYCHAGCGEGSCR